MGKIFISYSRNDLEIVDKFAAALQQAGIDTWIDRESIKVGNSWRKEIVEAIDNCDAFVFIMSASSIASKNVHKEIILSQDSSKPIYVVMLEVVRLPAEIRYQLAGLQFINFPLLGFEKSAEQLITALKPHQKKTKSDENKQAELVIQGIDISAFTAEKQAELLAFISNLTNTDSSQLKIANVTAGSVHVFVDMPADTAFQLKTFALNRDSRFS
ncbi:MAG TPA: toll/interleukin-1 receptor domain-containing protein, partial [Anaerolineales bacterium]|nr:toll/interleukin-1 receptor domain-containing protein [Anaerolineales bacterium]